MHPVLAFPVSILLRRKLCFTINFKPGFLVSYSTSGRISIICLYLGPQHPTHISRPSLQHTGHNLDNQDIRSIYLRMAWGSQRVQGFPEHSHGASQSDRQDRMGSCLKLISFATRLRQPRFRWKQDSKIARTLHSWGYNLTFLNRTRNACLPVACGCRNKALVYQK